MALSRKVAKEHFQYEERIAILSKEEEQEARERFADYVAKGVIIDCVFGDEVWYATNGYRKVKFDIGLGRDIYNATAAHKLGCSFVDMCLALRVYTIHMMTYALPTIKTHLAAVVKFVRAPELPTDDFTAYAVSEFLELLPGDTPFREEVHARACYPANQTTVKSPRSLADFRSYFWFGHLLDLFWQEAAEEEKLLYFPIYLWWKLTTILPLRVTEYVLTPRKCLVGSEGEGWRMCIRRTRLKTERGSAKHSIVDDYDVVQCPIPSDLAKAIRWYISETDHEYQSDLDTLLSKRTQQRLLRTSRRNDIYFASNLRTLLDCFYEDILKHRYHCVLADGTDDLKVGKINRIRLGDTRHIAIINLMVSGSSLVTCKELCHHFDVYSAQNYYANVTAFLDALQWEYIVPSTSISMPQIEETQTERCMPLVRDLRELTKTPAGYCVSPRYANGDYSDCVRAVNSSGNIGDCGYCNYWVPDKASHRKLKEDNQNELMKVCVLLTEALNSYRSGEGMSIPIETVIAELQKEAAQYRHLSFLERKKIMEEGEANGK